MAISYTYTTLDYLNPYRTFLYDINNEGQIIGQYTTYGVNFLYSTSGGTFTPLTNLDNPFGPSTYSYASGINDSGQIVGAWNYIGDLPGASHGFLYSNGSFTDILDPNAGLTATWASSINNLGQVVGGYAYAPFIQHGFLYVGGAYTDIIYPLDPSGLNINPAVGVSTTATGINNLGQVVGDYSYVDATSGQTVTHGFIDNNGAYKPIDHPGATSTVVYGINNLGQIVGHYNDATGQHGFVLSGGVFTTLDPQYSDPRGIDDAGDIVGTYADSFQGGGVYRGFLATPIVTNHPPQIVVASSTLAGTINERPNVTGSLAVDIVNGAIAFTDADLTDRPTASVIKQTVVYHDAAGHDDTVQLTSTQITAFDNAFLTVPEAGNTNNGKIDWGYTIGDSALDFLGAGESIVVTSTVRIDDGHGGMVDQDVTVTLNGANDTPVAVLDSATAERGTSANGSVLANDSDSDIHDTLHVKVFGFGNSTSVPDFNGFGTIQGALGTLTFNANGNYNYNVTAAPTKSGQELFTYTVDDGHGGVATSSLIVTVQASSSAGKPSSGLQRATNLFQSYGFDGKVVFLSTLAEAAYHLIPNFENQGEGVNTFYPLDETAYQILPKGLQLLTPADLPSLTPHIVSNADFPTVGLIQGIYVNENAAALVARSADSLFISFRGTNDTPNILQDVAGGLVGHGGTPDSNDWSAAGMMRHYGLLRPLVRALDSYLSTHTEIKNVYVTGHSLGAAMGQHVLSDDIVAHHPGISFEATLFANPGFPTDIGSNDARITNIDILGDQVVELSPYLVRGDIYQVVDFNANSNGGNFHDMTLYHDVVQFLSSVHDSVPLSFPTALASNNHQDLTKVFVDIANVGSPSSVQPDTWQVSMPTGVVPLPFDIVPSFDPRADKTFLPHEMLGVLGGGSLSGVSGSSDTFTFNSGFGHVLVTNFEPGLDVLQISQALFGGEKAALANVANDAYGNAVFTDAAGDTAVLLGISRAQLHVTDFHIV